MKIHQNFIGGNIRVKEISGSTVTLENELRDTEIDWFYWAFCVEGAGGDELTFTFQDNRLGYWGPAVSYDIEHWHWLNSVDKNSFTYSFAENENRVYFAHHILYHPDRFLSFAKKKGITVSELCKSRKGRSVPCVILGNGRRNLLLTARHHACESTGNYVLEGVLGELTRELPHDLRIFCVPFVDFDGVLDGDQGKSRAPHDHNRDYAPETDSIYPEVAAIRAYTAEYGCNWGFDFHSPWHRGNENDTVFIVRNRVEKQEAFERFATLFEMTITDDSMAYRKKNDHPANTGWNQPSANFAFTMNSRPECTLAFTLESTYFGTEENKVSSERLIALGKCFAATLKKYIT